MSEAWQRAGPAEMLALATAVALPIALHASVVHVVPSGPGTWRGLTDPPSLPAVVASALVGLLVALALAYRPPPVRRPVLLLALAAAPIVPLLTGALVPLIAFQGPVMIVAGAAAAGVALTRAASLRILRLPALADARWRTLGLFGAAFFFYAVLGTRIPGPAGPQGDEPHYLVMADSLLRDGDLDLANEFADRAYRDFYVGPLQPHTSPASPRGTLYPVHAPGLAVLILPAYALGGYPAVRLWLSALAALTGLLVHRLARESLGSDAAALAVWAVLTFTPPLPFYAVAVYPEVPAAAATALFLLTSRRDGRGLELLAAAGAAAALPWLHPKFLPLAALGLGLTVARRGPRGARAAAAATLIASVAALLFFFHRTYGQASLAAAYGPGFRSDVSLAQIPWGALALLLDRQFGLLAVGPVWALALPGLVLLGRRRPGDALRAGLLAAASLGVGASFSMWWGGACPPARFVVPALPALALALAPALAARRDAAAALGGLGLAIVALAADAPRALHNRGDGESGLLRFLAPGLDLDGVLPSFVLGAGALLLGVTLAAGLALAWARGRRGLVLGALAYGLVAGATRETPLLDARQATRRLLEAWDPARVAAASGPLALQTLSVPLDLRTSAGWILSPGKERASGRIDLPPGLYRVDVSALVLAAPRATQVARLEVTADGVRLGGAALDPTQAAFSFPLLLPAGAPRLRLTATGVGGTARVDTVAVVPEALVPRDRRAEFAWPRLLRDDRYRVAFGPLRVTALDPCKAEPGAFRLEGEDGSFLIEAAPATRVTLRVLRHGAGRDDAVAWSGGRRPVTGEQTEVALPLEAGVPLGSVVVVPVRVEAYGASITFSGSPGGTSATDSSAASPGDLPMVTRRSAPPDSGK